MTESNPKQPFSVKDLDLSLDKAKAREHLSAKLQGKTWTCEVQTLNSDQNGVIKSCALGHPDFREHIYLSAPALLKDVEKGQCISGSVGIGNTKSRKNRFELRDPKLCTKESDALQQRETPDVQGVIRAEEQILKEAEQLVGSWKHDEKERFKELEAEFYGAYPDKTSKFNALKKLNTDIIQLLDLAYKSGRGVTPKRNLQEIRHKANQLGGSGLENKVTLKFEKGQKAKERAENEKKLKANGVPLSNVKPRNNQARPVILPKGKPLGKKLPEPPSGLHPNDLRALSPASEWTLLLDETGKDFIGDGKKHGVGKFVGLLMNKQNPCLADLSSAWHAVESGDARQIDKIVQAVLDAPCGVIGLTLDALPRTPGERWLDGMLAVMDWVLRLLPLDGPTRIHVAIEGRPPFPPEVQARFAAREALSKFARVWPERAKLIDLRIETISKDANPFNGYVDALAFTWGSPARSSKERLKMSGLNQTCLLAAGAESMISFWDYWDQPGGLPADKWADLVASAEAHKPESIAYCLLTALADACKASPDRVQPYLEECRRHLNSKALNLRRLAAQIDWLKPILESKEDLTPVMQLIWLTSRLAQANHIGALEQAWNRQLHALSTRLFDEEARLVCHADLHLAVNATNCFDFTRAEQILEPWQDSNPAIPGLRLWGQVQSSLGQVAAFTGKYEQADDFFAKAVDTFRRLSDPMESTRECAQTTCYRVIAAMDNPRYDDESVKKLLTDYFHEIGLPQDPEKAALNLAESVDAYLKYAHHTLLRWLVFRGDQHIWTVYRSKQQEWSAGDGHPWQLIQIYRALLLYPDEADSALDLALDASSIAFTAGQGPTVQLIGTCCRSIAQYRGSHWPEAQLTVNALREALPLAVDRIDYLHGWLDKPDSSPDVMLASVLPFNFR